MRSPKDMMIIEIDVTNYCVHRCSNCTRFCGHHRKPFFMDYEFFKKAVDSLDNYEGMVGMIGGEPTLHPQFEDFVTYIQKKRYGTRIEAIRHPIHDPLWFILRKLWHRNAKAVLCSSLTQQYYNHMEIIGDTYETQVLNDHQNRCRHQALLMSRKELGVSNSEWIKKRDACWVQNNWSATITPKGAFFCEVAGALDMLFDGPGGWEVELNWWKRTPEEFGKQLEWCELCSGCLDVPQRLSNDGRDDVTPQIFERLVSLGSPKALHGDCVIHDPSQFDSKNFHTFVGINDYMDVGDNQRINANNRNLYPKSFLLTSPRNFINDVRAFTPKDWIILADKPTGVESAQSYLSERILNPGCLYSLGKIVAVNVRSFSLRDKISHPETILMPIWKNYPLDKIIRINHDYERYCSEVSKLWDENKKLRKWLKRRKQKKLLLSKIYLRQKYSCL